MQYHNLYIVLANQIVNLAKKITQHIATANDNFF